MQFGHSRLSFEQRVWTLVAPAAILSKGFVLWIGGLFSREAWQDLAGSGRIWQDLARSGRILGGVCRKIPPALLATLVALLFFLSHAEREVGGYVEDIRYSDIDIRSWYDIRISGPDTLSEPLSV